MFKTVVYNEIEFEWKLILAYNAINIIHCYLLFYNKCKCSQVLRHSNNRQPVILQKLPIHLKTGNDHLPR